MIFPEDSAISHRKKPRLFIHFLIIFLYLIGLQLNPVLADSQKNSCYSDNRPITIYIPFTGGAAEKLTRLIGTNLSKKLNQEIIIQVNDQNLTATEYINQVKSVPTDGYHLIVGNLGTHASSLFTNKQEILYDPIQDFEPVALLGKTPMILVVRNDFPVNNFEQFKQYMQKESNHKMTIAHSGQGSTSFLAAVSLESVLKLNLEFIPYGGSEAALKDLAYGFVDIMVDQTTSVLPYILGGLVKPLVITSPTRPLQAQNIPSSFDPEVDLKEFNLTGWNMIFAPKGVRKHIINCLNKEINDTLENIFIQSELKISNTLILSSDENKPALLKKFIYDQITYWRDQLKMIEQKHK